MGVTTSVETSTSLRSSGFVGGVVLVSGVTASATLVVHGSTDGGVTFAPLHDTTGAAVTLVVPEGGGVVSLPDAASGPGLLRLVSTTDMGTAATVSVTVKS